MKDMLGEEICAGDSIVYASKPRNYPVLTIGKVAEVRRDYVLVERIHAGENEGYSCVRDGMWTRGGDVANRTILGETGCRRSYVFKRAGS